MTPDPAWPGALARGWFVACESRELGARPLQRTLFGLPLVLFRAEGGRAAVLVDRCPHRNFPLSRGRVEGGEIACAYHGWRFDGSGACRAIPALEGDAGRFGHSAEPVPALERDGVVWAWPARDAAPTGEPFALPLLREVGFTTVRLQALVRAPLLAAAENILDVPHTAHVHRGLFRTGARRAVVEVVTRRSAGSVEAEYVGEPRPSGLMGRLLAPGGGVVTHFDRFMLPSIAQVEYALGDDGRIVATHLLAPVTRELTRIFFVVTLKLRVPGWLAVPVVHVVGRWIIGQDARALRLQSENASRFGGERWHSTEVDVLGPHVAHLLERAARGEAAGEAPREWRSRIVP